MGRTALIISISYIVALVAVALLAVAVAVSTRGRGDADTATIAEREKTWFVVAVVLLTSLLFATIFFTPYGKTSGRHSQVVQVKAVQYAWLMPAAPIKAGRPVQFRLRSDDVSHNFAVYTASWKLLFQVQVLPGTEQRYTYTFRRPGTYRVACLEFCGLGHDTMQSFLHVSA